MQFIRSRFGIVLWCAIALVITAVPTFRWRASHQLESPLLSFSSPFGDEPEKPQRDYGLSPRREEQAAHQFSADPFAQLAALHGAKLYNITLALGEKPDNNSKVIRVQNEYYAHYDALERRFPNNNAVRAQHLRDIASGWFDIKEGPSSKFDRDRQNSSDKRPRSLSETLLKSAIQSAREGARREPDNAFFPWMEAALEFSLRNDNAAIAALQKAGECTRFQDYVSDTLLERLRLLRQLRPTGWEDDYYEMSGVLLPHYSQIGIAARATMGRARLARARGDEARALEIAGILQRAGAVLAQSEGLILTRLYGQIVCVMAWKTILENEPSVTKSLFDDKNRTDDNSRRIAALFAVYAREHQRPDLAGQAQSITAKFSATQLSTDYKSSDIADFSKQAPLLGKAFFLGGVALIFGLSATIAWLLSWPFSRREQEAKSRRQSLLWAMFAAGASPMILGAAVILLPKQITDFWSDSYRINEPADKLTGALKLLNDYHGTALALLWVAPIVIAMLLHLFRQLNGGIWRNEPDGNFNWKRITAAILSIGFSVSLIGIVLGLQQTVDSVFNRIFPVAMITWFSCSFIGGILLMLWSRGKARPVAISLVCALWLGVAALMNGSSGDGPFYSAILWFLAGLSALYALFFAARSGQLPATQIKDFLFQLAARTRIAAGVLALLCAIAYFGITLWTIPVEHQTRAMMQRQLQIGEVAWLREQMAARK